MKKNKILLLGVAAFVAVITGCSESSSDDTSTFSTSYSKADVIENYADIVLASYEDSLAAAQTMKLAIDAFVSSPSTANLDIAKDAWLAARVPYGQTEGYRFASGPIDDEDGPEGQLNAWPLDESHIDYVESPTSAESQTNLIANTSLLPSITKEALAGLNEHDDNEANVATGWHAIEFLLWGQDLSDGPGAGERSFTDYTTDANASRRGQYLTTVTELLIDDLQSLVDEWVEGSESNYRATFLALDADVALTNIFKGAATMSKSELATERMDVALTLRSKEDEHSCFSDNTHSDIIQNAQSINNILMGDYVGYRGTTIQGPGLYDLIGQTNADLANSLRTISESAMTYVNAIEAPFDQEILASNAAGNIRIETAVTALQTQGDLLVSGGAVLGLTLNADLPE
jgi:putative iron-regulated protein